MESQWSTNYARRKCDLKIYFKIRYRLNREKMLALSKKWHRENPERARDLNKMWREKNPKYCTNYNRQIIGSLREEIFSLLGGAKCKRCGFDDKRALQIDHIHGGGCKEFKIAKKLTVYYHNIITKIRSGSKEYQILCANCNWIKREEMKECD